MERFELNRSESIAGWLLLTDEGGEATYLATGRDREVENLSWVFFLPGLMNCS